MNDKLFIWAQGDREFAQVLLFVKVCAFAFRICLHWDNMTSRIHARNVLCLTGCTSQHCKYNTKSQSRSRRMQSDFIPFPFCLLFWLPKKFVYQICFTVILSSPSRVMMPVHFSWPLVKSIWAVALVSPKLSLIETDGVHLKGPMEVCYFWCLQPTQILRHTGKHNHADVDTQQSLHLCVHTDNHKHEQHMQMHM